jgi:hypothetical protein
MILRYPILVFTLLLLSCIACAEVVPLGESLIPLAKRPILCDPSHTGFTLDEHPNIRINSDNSGQIQNEEQACISPTLPNQMVAVWRDFRFGYRRCGFGRSTNSGTTWTDGVFPQMYYSWQSDPCLVVDADGIFTAMVISFDPAAGGEDGLLQVSSYDGGATWQDSVWAAHATQPVGFEDKEMLTIDMVPGSLYFGTFYCAWAHFYGANPYDSTHIWLVYKRPGQAYSTPRIVSRTTSNQWANVCVGANGAVYVSWGSYQYGGIMFSRSVNGGDTWSNQTLVTTTDFVNAEIEPNLLVFAYGAMAVDLSGGPHNGRLYMVLTDAAANETDVWLIYSDNGGQSWSNRMRMDDEQASFPVDQFHPWISVDEEGRVWVVFYDRRNDPNGLLMDLYFTVSTNGGQSWRLNERITTVSSDPGAGTLDAGLIGEYIGWDARGGKALAVWTDTRLGNQDAYSAVIDSIFIQNETDNNFILHPSFFSLSAFPNPFNPSTNIALTLTHTGKARLTIYDITGREVNTIHEGVLGAGEHRFIFDGAHLPSGIYFARLESAGLVKTQKLLLLK